MRGDDPDGKVSLIVIAVEFPACAGMIRRLQTPPYVSRRVPRMRGDDPSNPEVRRLAIESSPHARG